LVLKVTMSFLIKTILYKDNDCYLFNQTLIFFNFVSWVCSVYITIFYFIKWLQNIVLKNIICIPLGVILAFEIGLVFVW